METGKSECIQKISWHYKHIIAPPPPPPSNKQAIICKCQGWEIYSDLRHERGGGDGGVCIIYIVYNIMYNVCVEIVSIKLYIYCNLKSNTTELLSEVVICLKKLH